MSPVMVRLPTGGQICRHYIPVDSSWHQVKLSGPVLAVAVRRADRVDFWSLRLPDEPELVHEFRAIGVGDTLPEDVLYVDSAIGVSVAWHLVERLPDGGGALRGLVA